MVIKKYCYIFSIFSFVHLIKASNVEYDGIVNINLQHALISSANPVFTNRGNITIQSLRTGSSVVNQEPLDDEDRIKLRDLAAENKFYQLKSTVITSDKSETTFLSTVKACMLVEADLNDILSVSLDYSGRVIAVTLAVSSTSKCEGAVVPVSRIHEFTTSVYVRHAENGPIPDVSTYIQKLEKEREAKERGEVKDNRSFFAKYWMYIVPVVIIMVLSSAANPGRSSRPLMLELKLVV